MSDSEPRTFCERCAAFWEWFPTIAGPLAERMQEEQDGGGEMVNEVRDVLQDILPGMCWVFGYDDPGMSFTFTGEGQVAKQLLAEYWLSQAVEVPGWTFHASRQPSDPERVAEMAIAFGDDDQVDAENILIRTSIDDENELVDIAAWHPTFARIDEQHHLPILFIFLDEALGEFGTQTWIGEIQLEPLTSGGSDVRKLPELRPFIDSVSRYHEWEKLPPLEAYSLYEIREQNDTPRGDTLFGSTCIPSIVFEYIENEGRLDEDPFDGLGAEFVYVALDSSMFPQGGEMEVRNNIEDAIDDALRDAGSGRSLGGAFGVNESYLEFLLLDGEASREIVAQTLESLQLSGRSRIATMS